MGHPDSGLICGLGDCMKPGLVWLTKEEQEEYRAGRRFFRLNATESGVKFHVC